MQKGWFHRMLLNFYQETVLIGTLEHRLNCSIKCVPNYTQSQLEFIRDFKAGFKLFYEEDVTTFYKLGITNIQFDFSKPNIEVVIELIKPGILIGKGGRNIDKLTSYLNNYLDTTLKINIVESKLWHNYQPFNPSNKC